MVTCRSPVDHKSPKKKNGIYWKDQKDDMDGVTIPAPYLQQFLYMVRSHIEQIMICTYIVTTRHEAVRFVFESNLVFHRSFAFLSTDKCKR